ncbi:hypothetical protein AB0M47_34030, partial [Hamadaea sp. NPDC051192]|uniref:hypothetical protein n=1 Tax=Hamadaea sp. NPDC051192 TaxID=3154940 RepID=UPI003425BF14
EQQVRHQRRERDAAEVGHGLIHDDVRDRRVAVASPLIMELTVVSPVCRGRKVHDQRIGPDAAA